ncbi:putative mRNA capping enzyme; large subunit [Paratrimastix pyriformis]|uniref:mRNA (guanine-N(7))-methyltransferase n=1 Tax=Paratrimastix pyriformis TaxID=342808 RepID=A0ABQ8US10_9EUKA|nr:putative mRNA capping enzyme; large subunit [Paratrimastix pyriformis]
MSAEKAYDIQAAQYQNKGTRKFSPGIAARNFNNWVKAVLIHRFCREGAHVLDLGCGRGGDLPKYIQAKLGSMTGVDISSVSLDNYKDRYKQARQYFPLDLIHADFTQDNLFPLLGTEPRFHLISCQFALHYAFASMYSANLLFETVGRLLLPGHYFIATVPNAIHIVKHLRETNSRSFGNQLFAVTFEKRAFPEFGARYRFRLGGSTADAAAVDADEYLVHPTSLKRPAPIPPTRTPQRSGLATQHGLVLESWVSFRNFFVGNVNPDRCSNAATYTELFSRIVGGAESLTQDEWDLINFYSVAVFRKPCPPGTVPPAPPPRPPPPPTVAEYPQPTKRSIRRPEDLALSPFDRLPPDLLARVLSEVTGQLDYLPHLAAVHGVCRRWAQDTLRPRALALPANVHPGRLAGWLREAPRWLDLSGVVDLTVPLYACESPYDERTGRRYPPPPGQEPPYEALDDGPLAELLGIFGGNPLTALALTAYQAPPSLAPVTRPAPDEGRLGRCPFTEATLRLVANSFGPTLSRFHLVCHLPREHPLFANSEFETMLAMSTNIEHLALPTPISGEVLCHLPLRSLDLHLVPPSEGPYYLYRELQHSCPLVERLVMPPALPPPAPAGLSPVDAAFFVGAHHALRQLDLLGPRCALTEHAQLQTIARECPNLRLLKLLFGPPAAAPNGPAMGPAPRPAVCSDSTFRALAALGQLTGLALVFPPVPPPPPMAGVPSSPFTVEALAALRVLGHLKRLSVTNLPRLHLGAVTRLAQGTPAMVDLALTILPTPAATPGAPAPPPPPPEERATTGWLVGLLHAWPSLQHLELVNYPGLISPLPAEPEQPGRYSSGRPRRAPPRYAFHQPAELDIHLVAAGTGEGPEGEEADGPEGGGGWRGRGGRGRGGRGGFRGRGRGGRGGGPRDEGPPELPEDFYQPFSPSDD